MIKFCGRTIAAFTLCAIFCAAQKSNAPAFALLEPGEFHGDEVSLTQPRMWLGLFCSHDTCETRPAVVTTRRVHDDVVDENTRNNTGTGVFVGKGSAPLFLLHGLPLKQVPVPVAFLGEQNLYAGESLSLTGLAAGYLLHVDGKQTQDKPLPAGARLTFSVGNSSQVLFVVPKENSDPSITVYWVGDLDGDGKPDLLMNLSENYNVVNKVLWLSSRASKGHLLEKVAILRTTGC